MARPSLYEGHLTQIDGHIGRIVYIEHKPHLDPIPGMPPFDRILVSQNNGPVFGDVISATGLANVLIGFAAASAAAGVCLTAVKHDMGMDGLGVNQLQTFKLTPDALRVLVELADDECWTEVRRNVVCYRIFGVTLDEAAEQLNAVTA